MCFSATYKQQGKDPLYKTWHRSTEDTFLYLYTDGGSIVTNEKNYPMVKGALCFIGTGKYHYTIPDEPNSYIRSKLFVPGHILKNLSNLLPDNSLLHSFASGAVVYAQIPEERQAEVDAIFVRMASQQSSSHFNELVLYDCCIQLLLLLSAYCLESTGSPAGFVSKAIEYINTHLEENLSIECICSHIGLSKYYFCRQFKKATGLTLMEYILNTRVVLSKSMLLDKALSISQIADRCGFSSLSYFSRTFKEETGQTPSQYRKSLAP